MGLFERWLTVWVGLCIVAGIRLGQLFPARPWCRDQAPGRTSGGSPSAMVVRGSAAHAAMASSVNQAARLPRWRRLAS